MAKGTKGFFIWLRANMPRVYQDVRKEFRDTARLSGIGLADPVATATEAPPSSTLVQTIKDIANIAAQGYLTREQIKAQQQILNLNLQRAQQNLPMLNIDPAQYGLQPSVGVGLTDDTKQLLLYGGIGIGALWLLSMVTGKRR
jgi:hypothetical protein